MELGQINEIDSQIQNLNDPLGYKKNGRKRREIKNSTSRHLLRRKPKTEIEKRKRKKNSRKIKRFKTFFLCFSSVFL